MEPCGLQTGCSHLGSDPLLQGVVLCWVGASVLGFSLEWSDELLRILNTRMQVYRFGGPLKGSFLQLKRELTTTVWLRCLTFSVLRSLRVRKPRISAPIRQNALSCSGVRTWRTQWRGKTLVVSGTHTVFAFGQYTPDSTSHAVYRWPTKTPTEKRGTGPREETPWTSQDWENLERETDTFCPDLRRGNYVTTMDCDVLSSE